MKYWIQAARPKTLPAAIVPVWVGNAPVLLGNFAPFSWLIFGSTLLSCLCIQIATNLFNDAIDFDKGADTGARLGPVRVTASGLISRKKVLNAAIFFCVLAALMAIPLVMRHGWIPIAIGSVSLLLSYGYTGGPFPLAYRGMGELFVIVFFGFVAVLGSYFMQTGQWFSFPGWIVALQVGCYSCVLIAVNNLRDIEEDRRSEKMTLAARFGRTFARWEIALFCFAPLFMWLVYPAGSRIGMGVSLFIATLITVHVFTKEPGSFYNKILVVAALQLINFAIWFSEWVAT